MWRMSLAIAVLAAIAASYGLGRRQSLTASETERHALYYVDPMHPAYKSARPGVAPDCGMELEPVFADTARSAPQLHPGAVSIDGATRQSLGIRLAPVERAGATRVIRVAGRVAPEDTRVYRINSGVDGFVRETYDDSSGTPVKKDQRLATYYAPEFIAAASGFLAANERIPGSVAKEGARSIQNYTDRLRNLGMSEVQIKQIAATRQLPESIDVVAPADGFILARNISPGQHFEHGMEIYRIADLSRVWVVAEVLEQDAPYLRPGSTARIALKREGRHLPARITDSLPQSEAGGGTVKLRLEVDNPANILRPEMVVDVDLPVHLPTAVTVPLDAVVDSGERARVYVEHGEGVFEPRQVETGWRYGERVEILRGVRPGERVVTAATFLIDSESRLKAPEPAPARRTDPLAAAGISQDPNCGMLVDPAKATASGTTLAYRGVTYYFCSSECKRTFQENAAARARQHQGSD